MALTEKYVTSAGAGSADGSSLANALSWASMVTAINGGGTAGNRYNVSGAISRTTTTDTISGSGTSTSPVIIRGYSSVITDGYLGRTNGNGALITTNMPALSYTTGRLAISGSWIIVEAMNVTGAPANPVLSVGPEGGAVNSLVTCTSTNGSSVSLGSNRSHAINCDVLNAAASGGGAALSSSSNGKCIGCRVRSVSGVGITFSGGMRAIVGNVIYRCGSHGIAINLTGGETTICNNTIVNCTGDGINVLTGQTTLQFLFNNLITDNGAYGINGVSAANAILAAYNRLDRNTTAATNLATDWLAATSYGHNTTSVTAAQEYVDQSTDDYRLMSTSPALSNGLFAYADIGSLQRAASSSVIIVEED